MVRHVHGSTCTVCIVTCECSSVHPEGNPPHLLCQWHVAKCIEGKARQLIKGGSDENSPRRVACGKFWQLMHAIAPASQDSMATIGSDSRSKAAPPGGEVKTTAEQNRAVATKLVDDFIADLKKDHYMLAFAKYFEGQWREGDMHGRSVMVVTQGYANFPRQACPLG